MPSRSRSLIPGQMLAGRYLIVSLLGHGGMGEVYEAQDTVLGTSVALKTIRGEESETAMRRFQREVVLARSIAHPNICRVFDFFSDDSAGGFFTMELLRGHTVAEVLKQRGPLDLQEARKIALGVCDALTAAHGLGIIHRDLKPANIFLTDDGRVVVTDFGLARAAAGSGAFGAMETASQLVAGTPAYMAPEQLTGADPSPTADLYALGVVMYEMTTGHLPWSEHRESRFTATPPPPSTEPLWDAVTLRCLSVAPGRRFASAAELGETLRGKRIMLPNMLPWVLVAVAGMIGVVAILLMRDRSSPPRPEAVSWYERGVSALHDGDYNSAARQLQMAVEADSTYAMAHARLAEAWAEQDYADRARQSMLQASSVAANHPIADRTDAQRLLAIQMMVARDLAGSVARYREIAEAQRTPDTLYDLARALERNAETDEALAKYREVVASRDSYAAAWARLGALLGRKGDFPGATAAFAKAESTYNTAGNLAGVTEVRLRRAIVLSSYQGQVAAAAQVLDSALKLAEATGFESQRIRILLRRGILARQNEASGEAEQYASEALRLADENRMEQYSIDGLLELGNVYLQKRDLVTAEKHAASALRFARSQNSRLHEARAMGLIASVRSQQSKLEEARSGAERALGFFRGAGYRTEMLSMLALLAQVRSQSGDAAGALSAFEEQLKLTNPTNARAIAALHLRIGISQANLERYAEALPHLDEALNAPDATTRAYAAVNKADVLAVTGATAEARRLLADEKLLSEPSGIVKARASVVRAAASLEEARYAEAIREAEEARARLGTQDPYLRRRVEALQALAFANSGNTRKALSLCAEPPAETADPRAAAAALLHCAEAALVAKQRAAAIARADEAGKLLAKLGQPEAQWRACLVRVSADPASGSANICEDFRKAAAERWGKDLWDRYLTRADVQARLARRSN